MNRLAAWVSFSVVSIVLAESLFVASHIAHLDIPAGYNPVRVAPLPTYRDAYAHHPIDSGANLPPNGRSLFDRLMVGTANAWPIPFPFTKLLAHLGERAGCGDGSCYRAVLIPLGRSLQRTAAAPEFFKYPRMVVAFNAEPRRPVHNRLPLLKDRLYLGYQEKANVIEVISYNDAAGRFEFQLVKDYRQNATPRIVYANRAVCLSCHQNQAPIFSRQVWDETNANPEIARRLMSARKDFLGFPISVGVDVPNAMDDATDRANLYSAYQALWRDGCSEPAANTRSCRAQALRAALQYRLTEERGFAQRSSAFMQRFVTPLQTNWQRLWPDGMRIPSNDIPNRDPLQFADSERLAHVPARFEALLPRGHKEIWQFETDRFRLIKGIGEFFSRADISLLAQRLKLQPRGTKTPDDELWSSPGFATLDTAIEHMVGDPAGQAALDSPTIQREPLLNALLVSLALSDANRESISDLPPAQMDEDSAVDVGLPSAHLAPFYAHCSRCHATREPFPPNFMSGSADRVADNLRRCANRIFFRLAMWSIPAERRPKTPMPPATVLAVHEQQWSASADLAAMRDYLAPYVHGELQQAPEKLVSSSYEALPSCTLH